MWCPDVSFLVKKNLEIHCYCFVIYINNLFSLNKRISLFKIPGVLCLSEVSDLSVLHYLTVFVIFFIEIEWNGLFNINVRRNDDGVKPILSETGINKIFEERPK